MSKHTKVGSMTKVSAYHHRRAESRLRPARDGAYLNALAVRLADIAGLTLKQAKQRVEQMAISAGAGNDRGGWPTQMLR